MFDLRNVQFKPVIPLLILAWGASYHLEMIIIDSDYIYSFFNGNAYSRDGWLIYRISGHSYNVMLWVMVGSAFLKIPRVPSFILLLPFLITYKFLNAVVWSFLFARWESRGYIWGWDYFISLISKSVPSVFEYGDHLISWYSLVDIVALIACAWLFNQDGFKKDLHTLVLRLQ